MIPAVDRVPDWDFAGLLPPIDWDAPLTASLRSPYFICILELVVRFGITDARRRLLTGLLDYRAALHQAGLTRGFQWINGSFLENVEEMEGRDPKDIDIATFFHIPDGHTERTLVDKFRHLFDADQLKTRYAIDAYSAMLDPDDLEAIVQRSVYWYSVWSHTRDGIWKGYLQVKLGDEQDEVARSELERIANEGGQS